ncbi:MAG TPA: ATP cone domain-containing protein, partial [Terriglobales bacterium]
ISMSKLERLVNEVEAFVVDSSDRERSTTEIGEQIMERLKQHDTVAFIRFASVYRDFKDVREFHAELEQLVNRESKAQQKSKSGAKN